MCGYCSGSGWGGAIGDEDDKGWGDGVDAGGGKEAFYTDFEGELAGVDGWVYFSAWESDDVFGDELGPRRFVVFGGDGFEVGQVE